MKPVTETYEGLCKLLHDLTHHTGGMTAYSGDSFEQLVVAIAIVEPLLPSLSNLLWSDYTSENSSSPTLADLVKFLKNASHKSKTLHVHEQVQDHCPCCDAHHNLYQCSQFKSLTVDKRHNVVRNHHLCFNCLGKGHSVDDCSSRYTCSECRRKHHSLLH